MAGKKPLHELLSLDQDPFLLPRRRQLTHPLSEPKSRDFHFPVHYLKRMRFVGYHEPNKSPLFEFPSAAATPRSPCLKTSVSLRVPPRTAALLLEAASRIQRTGSARLPRKRSSGNGFLGLIMKRFARWKSKKARFGRNDDEDELSHVETASGGGRHGLDNYVEENLPVCNMNSYESSLLFETPDCNSPDSRSPELSSPAAFPKHFVEGNEEAANHILKGKNIDEEHEERVQFSPVSVLDPLIEVDDEDEEMGNVGFNYDCSYAFVQRTKEHLLDKLQRFERLARLDPVELEKKMLDSDEEESLSLEDSGFHGSRKSPNGELVAEESVKRVEVVEWKGEEEEIRMLGKEIEVGMLESLLEELIIC